MIEYVSSEYWNIIPQLAVSPIYPPFNGFTFTITSVDDQICSSNFNKTLGIKHFKQKIPTHIINEDAYPQ